MLAASMPPERRTDPAPRAKNDHLEDDQRHLIVANGGIVRREKIFEEQPSAHPQISGTIKSRASG
jgi:hypothetical protein